MKNAHGISVGEKPRMKLGFSRMGKLPNEGPSPPSCRRWKPPKSKRADQIRVNPTFDKVSQTVNESVGQRLGAPCRFKVTSSTPPFENEDYETNPSLAARFKVSAREITKRTQTPTLSTFKHFRTESLRDSSPAFYQTNPMTSLAQFTPGGLGLLRIDGQGKEGIWLVVYTFEVKG